MLISHPLVDLTTSLFRSFSPSQQSLLFFERDVSAEGLYVSKFQLTIWLRAFRHSEANQCRHGNRLKLR